jgi:hypothetical protein
LVINRMLRLYTNDECRFCKARFAIYNGWQRQDTYREFLRHILKHDLNPHNTYGHEHHYQVVGTLLTYWISLHLSQWVHTYPSVWSYMLKPEIILTVLGITFSITYTLLLFLFLILKSFTIDRYRFYKLW